MIVAPSLITILMASGWLNQNNDVASERVDLIEVNHFYDEQGDLVFDQIIFYDWSHPEGRYHVRAWRLLKTPAQLPRKSWKDRSYVAIWHEGEVLRARILDAIRSRIGRTGVPAQRAPHGTAQNQGSALGPNRQGHSRVSHCLAVRRTYSQGRPCRSTRRSMWFTRPRLMTQGQLRP